MFKLIIGAVLIFSSAFIGKTEKVKNGDYRCYAHNGEVIIEQEEYTYRKKFRSTGEAIGAVTLIIVGTGFVVSYLFEKDEESDKKGDGKSEKEIQEGKEEE